VRLFIETVQHIVGHFIVVAFAGLMDVDIDCCAVGLLVALGEAIHWTLFLGYSSVDSRSAVFCDCCVVYFAVCFALGNGFLRGIFGSFSHLVLPAVTLCACLLQCLIRCCKNCGEDKPLRRRLYQFSRVKGLSAWQTFRPSWHRK